MKNCIFILTWLFPLFLTAQTLELAGQPKSFKEEFKIYINPIIEPNSKFGVYLVKSGNTQSLFIFSKNEKFSKKIKTIMPQQSFGNVVAETNEVALSPCLFYDSEISFLSYVYVNNKGKFQIETIQSNKDWTDGESSEEYKLINYPQVILTDDNKYLSMASVEKNLVYSCSYSFFKNMQIIKNKLPGSQDIGPVFSPNKEYVAYTKLFLNSNKSNVVIAKIKRNGNNLELIEKRFIDNGPNIHNQSPSWSPDGKKIAYYSNMKTKDDVFSIYIYDIENKKHTLAAEKAFKKTMMNRGPAWLNDDIIVYVKHAPKENYPIYYTSVSKKKEKKLDINTTMNKDISIWKEGNYYNMLFVSIGELTNDNIAWNKIYQAKLRLIK